MKVKTFIPAYFALEKPVIILSGQKNTGKSKNNIRNRWVLIGALEIIFARIRKEENRLSGKVHVILYSGPRHMFLYISYLLLNVFKLHR